MEPVEADNPFWQFSLRVYGAKGVAAECLEVQDKLGIDVNLLLFGAWLGAARGVILQRAALDRVDLAVARWSAEIVQPLRAVRRQLKLVPDIVLDEVQALRKRVADAELVSEQLEQAFLYRIADGMGRPAKGSAAAARENVSMILATRGGSGGAFPMHGLLAACSVG